MKIIMKEEDLKKMVEDRIRTFVPKDKFTLIHIIFKLDEDSATYADVELKETWGKQ